VVKRGLKTECSADGKTNEQVSTSLVTKLMKLVENYLHISSLLAKNLIKINAEAAGWSSFCKKCKLFVINPLCEIYLQFLSAQLRLSLQLRQLGSLIEASQSSMSNKLRLTNIKALASQLGIDNVAQLEEFRSTLAKKCKI